MAIITDLTYEQALEYPEPKDIYVEGSQVYIYTDEHLSPRPNPIPQEVEADQMRLALLESGLLQTAIDYVNASSNDGLKIKFEYRVKWRRDSASIAAFAAEIGLTDEQIDELFIRAASK